MSRYVRATRCDLGSGAATPQEQIAGARVSSRPRVRTFFERADQRTSRCAAFRHERDQPVEPGVGRLLGRRIVPGSDEQQCALLSLSQRLEPTPVVAWPLMRLAQHDVRRIVGLMKKPPHLDFDPQPIVLDQRKNKITARLPTIPYRFLLQRLVETFSKSRIEQLVVDRRLIGIEQATDEGLALVRTLQSIEQKRGYLRVVQPSHGTTMASCIGEATGR